MDSNPKDRNVNLLNISLKCSFCDYKTHVQSNLYNHIRTHTKERPYKCTRENCNSTFSQKIHLDAHQLVHKKDDESLYKFKCSKCPYKTMIKGRLQPHLKTHSDIKEFSCDLCPFRSKEQKNITRHNKIVHLKLKPFKCPQPNCNYICSQKSHLTTHLIVHSEVKQFECDLCPYRTKHKCSLVSHKKLVHTTLKPFKCRHPDCNFSCKQSSHLIHHMNIHVVDKPLSCTFPDCTFTTKWKESLKNHERAHRGERPMKCSLCPKDFRDRRQLNNHIRGHTGETPYPCPRCPFRAKLSTLLKKHLKICKLETNGEVAEKKGCNFPINTAFKCKVAACGFLTEKNSSMAIHYNNCHYLPRVYLTKKKNLIISGINY